MNNKTPKSRVSFRASEKVDKYIEGLSDMTGQSPSVLIDTMLKHYIQLVSDKKIPLAVPPRKKELRKIIKPTLKVVR